MKQPIPGIDTEPPSPCHVDCQGAGPAADVQDSPPEPALDFLGGAWTAPAQAVYMTHTKQSTSSTATAMNGVRQPAPRLMPMSNLVSAETPLAPPPAGSRLSRRLAVSLGVAALPEHLNVDEKEYQEHLDSYTNRAIDPNDQTEVGLLQHLAALELYVIKAQTDLGKAASEPEIEKRRSHYLSMQGAYSQGVESLAGHRAFHQQPQPLKSTGKKTKPRRR